jgi:glycosyltransferase involved in cell wall biosynthesis
MKIRVHLNSGDEKFDLVYLLSETRDDSEWLIELLKRSNLRYRILVIVFSDALPQYLEFDTRFKFIWIQRFSKFQILSTVLRIKKLLWGKKISMFHSHGFIAAIISTSLKILTPAAALVVSRHHGVLHTITKNRLAAKVDRIISKIADHTIVYSTAMKDALLQIEDVAESNIHVLPLCISNENKLNVTNNATQLARVELGLKDVDFVIGTNSRDAVWKGLGHVIDAAAELAKTYGHVGLIMINVSPESSVVTYAQSKIGDCNFVTHLKVSNLQSFYNSIDVFCHVPISRFAEPAGLVYLEALAAGVPTIYTQSGLMNEIYPSPNWFKVDYESTSQIFSVMRFLLEEKSKNSETFYEDYVLKSSRIPERYSIENSVREQLDFYEKFMP